MHVLQTLFLYPRGDVGDDPLIQTCKRDLALVDDFTEVVKEELVPDFVVKPNCFQEEAGDQDVQTV
jgi:hypothetical protein